MPNICSIGSLGCLLQKVKLRHFQCKPLHGSTIVIWGFAMILGYGFKLNSHNHGRALRVRELTSYANEVEWSSLARSLSILSGEETAGHYRSDFSKVARSEHRKTLICWRMGAVDVGQANVPGWETNIHKVKFKLCVFWVEH